MAHWPFKNCEGKDDFPEISRGMYANGFNSIFNMAATKRSGNSIKVRLNPPTHPVNKELVIHNSELSMKEHEGPTA